MAFSEVDQAVKMETFFSPKKVYYTFSILQGDKRTLKFVVKKPFRVMQNMEGLQI